MAALTSLSTAALFRAVDLHLLGQIQTLCLKISCCFGRARLRVSLCELRSQRCDSWEDMSLPAPQKLRSSSMSGAFEAGFPQPPRQGWGVRDTCPLRRLLWRGVSGLPAALRRSPGPGPCWCVTVAGETAPNKVSLCPPGPHVLLGRRLGNKLVIIIQPNCSCLYWLLLLEEERLTLPRGVWSPPRRQFQLRLAGFVGIY